MQLENRQLARGGAENPLVLIADDDPVCSAALSTGFSRRGLRTITFRDGREAWRALKQDGSIFLAVLNWMLPTLDGHRICQRLLEVRPEVTTVLMVGRDFLLRGWKDMRLKAHYALAKPLSPAWIDETVRRMLVLASRRQSGPGRGQP